MTILGLQLVAQLAVVYFPLLQLFLLRVHLEKELRVPLLQAPTGHIAALGLGLQLGHLLLQGGLVGRDVPVVEGENGDDEQQGNEEE